MNNNQQKINWIIDAVLFGGLICAFFLDETGLPFHQWLGIAVGILSNYHLLKHWTWVKSVTRKLFGQRNGRARIYYVLDSVIAIGITAIVGTGLVISSWLDLNLENYAAWKNVHITTSVITLLVTTIKIGMHWKWIVKTARQFRISSPVTNPQLAMARVPVSSKTQMDRRDFLRIMGVVGAATIVASVKAFDGMDVQFDSESQAQAATLQNTIEETQTVASSETNSEVDISSTSVTTLETNTNSVTSSDIVAQQSSSFVTTIEESGTTQCTAQCPKSCSYPGHCRKYLDSNGNGRCDVSECA